MNLGPNPLSAPSGHVVGVLALLFLTSVLYAILLEYAETRWQFVSDQTWITVVVGVGYTLGGVALISWQAALLCIVAFAVTGIPIIARALIVDQRHRQELRKKWDSFDD